MILNELKPEDVMNILDRMDFFQGQRAGRELWHDKPFEVQEQDIADFTKGIAAVKAFIKVAIALLREKDAEIERLKNPLGHNDPVGEKVECGLKQRCRAETIDEFVAGCVGMAIGIYGVPVVWLESILKFAEKMKGESYGNKQGKTSKP